MLRTALTALVLAAGLTLRAEGQALTGPRLRAFHTLSASEASLLPLRDAAPGNTQGGNAAGGRGRSILLHTGIGLLVGAATGALVGPVLTNSACLAWNKDPANQTTCLDAFFTPREHVRSAVILGGVGAVVGAVTGLIARGGP